ncbi:hypothetical protein GCM10027446_10140 [Angustibacter peucedani]
MTATPETAPAPSLPAPGRRRAVIGRESISTADGRVVGYDLRFSGSGGVPLNELDDAAAHEAELLACRMLVASFGELGMERFGQRRQLYVNVPRPFLTGAVPLPFGPEHVVVQLLPDVDVDDAVLAGVVALKEQGYRLAVDSGCAGDALDRLYPLIDVLRVAVAEADDGLPDLVEYIRGIVPGAQLLADSLSSTAVADAAREAGFDLLQGVDPAPAAPRTTPGGARKVVPSQVVSLQLLAALSDPQSSADDLERIISVDPGLSIRVLGAVNSAAGTGRDVGSLRQALVLLGRKTLSTWVLLAAFGGESGDRQQMVTVLTRARTCELLTPQAGLDANTGYTAGLLSGVVDVLGADPAQIAHEARLQPEVSAALVGRQGAVGRLMAAVEEFDRSGTTDELSAEDVSRARLHALGDAVAAVDAVLGEG